MPWGTVQRLSSCVLPDAADGDGAHRKATHPAINATNPLLLPAPIGPLPPSSPDLQTPPQKRIIDRDRGDSFMVISRIEEVDLSAKRFFQDLCIKIPPFFETPTPLARYARISPVFAEKSSHCREARKQFRC
jgi:hypothetical protein